MTGFEGASTAALQAIERNLLGGLDVVATHLAAGTFDTCGPKGAAPPSQSGRLTLALLAGVTAELARPERAGDSVEAKRALTTQDRTESEE